MRVHEILRASSFERAIREAAAWVDPTDSQPLTAQVSARDGVLTVTVAFIYGVSIRVGGHYVGSTIGASTVYVTELLDALERDLELPGLEPSSTAASDLRNGRLWAPLTGWRQVARIDRHRFDTLLHRADRRLMDAVDRRAGDGRSDDGVDIEAVASAALSVPVDIWDLGDGRAVRLPGSFVFAAAMIGGLGDGLVLFEHEPWLCLSNGSVEILAPSMTRSRRVAIG